jgi:hypothetical protein
VPVTPIRPTRSGTGSILKASPLNLKVSRQLIAPHGFDCYALTNQSLFAEPKREGNPWTQSCLTSN